MRACLAAIGVLALAPAAAQAFAPAVGEEWSGEVADRSARLFARLQLDPVRSTSYRFNYITRAKYEANLATGKDGFAGALTVPPSSAQIAAGAATTTVIQSIVNLAPETPHLFRVSAGNSSGSVTGPTREFVTQPLGGPFALPDSRGWEMVSPVDKNGGQIQGPGEVAGGGVFQAAAAGGAVTYSSRASFGPGAQGAPPGSQYLARRGATGWSTENITAPVVSGSYGANSYGVPYELFSGDLAYGLMLNGRPCRGEGSGCPVANPPIPGSGAPSGYQNYYLRESLGGAFVALLDSTTLAQQPLSASRFEVDLAGATTDLAHVVLETCAGIGPAATEVPEGEGCDPAEPNLYSYDRETGAIAPVNVLPGDAMTTTGAALAAPAGAISADGERTFFVADGGLYLRDGTMTQQLDGTVGGGGEFQAASADGSVAYFSKAGHLYRFEADSGAATDLTPGGGVEGVLGASFDGSAVYYLSGSGLFLRQGLTTTLVAADADPANYPPATGVGRVSADGVHLLFISSASLTGYENLDLASGEAVPQVYLYDAAAEELTCVSCNPTLGRPIGPSSLPGATVNGTQAGATQAYKPRVLLAGGKRVVFESEDALAVADTNADIDVYQWESAGTGSCTRHGGCIALLSSGKSEGGAHFVDASADGSDVFFRTDRSLVPGDPGSIDLYDARAGGGLPVPTPPLPCEGDACQVLPSEPADPAVNTLVAGAGNPPVRFFDANRRKPRYHRIRNHRHKRRRGSRKAAQQRDHSPQRRGVVR